MVRVKGSAGNALARSLNESFRNLIIEGHVTDMKGDKWSSHSAVRNETHPHFVETKDEPKLNGVAYEEEGRQVFINHRSGCCHEGPMLLHPDNKASPFSHSGNPELFHSSHYFFASDE
jgi:hypothetical protein